MNSKKTFAINFNNGKWETLRLAHDVDSIHPFDASVSFHPEWETSNLLDMFLKGTYGELSFSGSNRDYVRVGAGMLAQVSGAFIRETGSCGFKPQGRLEAEQHYVLYGDWMDDGTGNAIVVPASLIAPDGKRVRTLYEMIGLQMHILEKSDRLKARKYAKRLKAYHRWAVPGEFFSERIVDVHSPIEVTARLIGEKVSIGRKIVGHALDMVFDGVRATALHVDLKQYGPDEVSAVDGSCYIDINFLHALGEQLMAVANTNYLRRMAQELLDYKIGDAYMGTYAAKTFFGKGIWHVADMSDSPYQFIVYGPKTQLEFDHVFLGSLGDVKMGQAFTDIQSMLSFMSNATRKLWTSLSRQYMLGVRNTIHDEAELRKIFLANIAPLAGMLEGDDQEIWSLIEALRHGLPITRFPGLFRKVVRHLMTVAHQAERGRIPYGDKAFRAYFMPDPNMIDFRTGHVDVNKSVIGEDQVCVPDAPAGQMIVIYRQPLAHNQEAIVAYNIGEDERKRFKRFTGRGRIIMGRGVREQLKRAGGADNDDSAVVLVDEKWVEAFATVEPYPPAELPADEAEALKSDDNPFLTGGQWEVGNETIHIPALEKGLKEPRVWSLADLWKACADAVQIQISIGPIDNAIRLDRHLSGDNKRHMLMTILEAVKDASSKGDRDAAALFLECAEWLRARKDDQLLEIANNLEDFIDNIKMGKGNQVALGKLIEKANHVTQTSKVFPKCWAWMGSRKDLDGNLMGRVPSFRKEAGDFVLAPSLVDETLETIIQDGMDLEAAFLEEQWRMAKPIPFTLEKLFPHNPEIGKFAGELRRLWYECWQLSFSGQIYYRRTPQEKVGQIILNGGVIALKSGQEVTLPGVRNMFMNGTEILTVKDGVEVGTGKYDEMLQAAVAVEVARRSYSQTYDEAQRNAEGDRRTYPDGLLWTNFMAKAFVRALKVANLAGMYVPVKFDRYDAKLRQGRIEVKLVGGIVMRTSDGHMIGYTIGEDVPDGEYSMVDGLIVVKEASPELTGIVPEGEIGLGKPITNQ